MGYPGWLGRWSLGRSEGAREVMVSARRSAVGVPESRNMSGMLPVLSLRIFMIIGCP